jgi:hypothetical protein
LKEELSALESLRFLRQLDGGTTDAAELAAASTGSAWRAAATRRYGRCRRASGRRVALARLALPDMARVWLLDEPFDALDAGGVEILNALLSSMPDAAADRPHQPPGAHHRRRRVRRRSRSTHRRRMSGSPFAAIVGRDLRLAARRRADALLPIAFFTVAISLFPARRRPRSRRRCSEIAPGVVWVAALLAAMLSVTQLYAGDLADGSLEQMLVASGPGAFDKLGLVLAKAAAHWLVTGCRWCWWRRCSA